MTSSEEHLKLAKQYLEAVQYDPSPIMVAGVERILAEASAKPEDIGTTQAKLDELRRRGYLNTAKHYLKMAMRNSNALFVDMVEDNLRQTQAQPEDIGTTQAALDELRQRKN